MKNTKIQILLVLFLCTLCTYGQTESTLVIKSATKQAEYELRKSPKLYDSTTGYTFTDRSGSVDFSKSERFVITVNSFEYLKGDMNIDGKVSLVDLTLSIHSLNDATDKYHGKVTLATPQMIVNKLLEITTGKSTPKKVDEIQKQSSPQEDQTQTK